MNDRPKVIARLLAFTFLAALVGTLAGAIFFFARHSSLEWYVRWEYFIFFFIFLMAIGIWAFPIWLFVFLPICAFLPPSSRLWHPLWFTVLGAILGAGLGYLIIGGFYHAISNDGLLRDGAETGAIVSGVAFFTASVIREKFRYN